MDSRELAAAAGFEFDKMSGPERAVVAACADPGASSPERPGMVRGELLAALAASSDIPEDIRRRGYRIEGMHIGGVLDLAWRDVVGALSLRNCRFDSPVRLLGARFREVDLSRSQLAGVDAPRAQGGDLVMDDACSSGQVDLSGGHFGRLGMRGVSIEMQADELALDANVVVVERSATFRGMRVRGRSRFIGARITGQLVLRDVHLDNTGGARPCLTVHEATVGRTLYLSDGTFCGAVNLSGARIDGRLDARQAQFLNPRGRAVDLKSSRVGRAAQFTGASFEGYVELTALVVGTALRFGGSTIRMGAEEERASVVPGDVDFDNDNDNDDTVDDERPAEAFRGDRMHVGTLYLGPAMRVEGTVTVAATTVVGAFEVEGSSFDGQGEDAFDGRRLAVGSTFSWLPAAVSGGVDLADASLGRLEDRPASWPTGVRLAGLTYGSVDTSRWRVAERVSWLASQTSFSPQPYEQLARALENQGDAGDAREVLASKETAVRRRGGLGLAGRVANAFLEITVRNGYGLHRAFGWLLLFTVAGGVVLTTAWDAGAVVSADAGAAAGDRCPAASACYSPVVYALDLLVPVIDFEQGDAWRIRSDVRRGPAYAVFGWVLIALGWALTTALVAGFGRLVQRK